MILRNHIIVLLHQSGCEDAEFSKLKEFISAIYGKPYADIQSDSLDQTALTSEQVIELKNILQSLPEALAERIVQDILTSHPSETKSEVKPWNKRSQRAFYNGKIVYCFAFIYDQNDQSYTITIVVPDLGAQDLGQELVDLLKKTLEKHGITENIPGVTIEWDGLFHTDDVFTLKTTATVLSEIIEKLVAVVEEIEGKFDDKTRKHMSNFRQTHDEDETIDSASPVFPPDTNTLEASQGIHWDSCKHWVFSNGGVIQEFSFSPRDDENYTIEISVSNLKLTHDEQLKHLGLLDRALEKHGITKKISFERDANIEWEWDAPNLMSIRAIFRLKTTANVLGQIIEKLVAVVEEIGGKIDDNTRADMLDFQQTRSSVLRESQKRNDESRIRDRYLFRLGFSKNSDERTNGLRIESPATSVPSESGSQTPVSNPNSPRLGF